MTFRALGNSSNKNCHLHLAFALLLSLPLALVPGCGNGDGAGGSGAGGSTPTISSVTVSCTPTSIQTGQTSQCSATVTGTGGYSSVVTWSVSPSSTGAISSAGVFTASAAGTATITASSTQDSTKSGTATIAVSAPTSITSVTVTCSPSSITTTQTSTCSATVQGAGSYSSAVTWSVSPLSAGSVSTAGIFTPAATGTATITATSTQDTTKSGSATVSVNSQQPTPTTPVVVPSILVGGQQTQVTVTCFVRGADASTQVQLFKLAGGTATLVGSMSDSGQNGDQIAVDQVYTIVATLTPPASTTSLPLQVVATEGTGSSLYANISLPLAQVPSYAANTDVNQAESSLYNTAIQVRSSFPTTDWTNSTQQQTFISNLISMNQEFTGIVQQNAALQAAVQPVKSRPLPHADATTPQPEGIIQTILDVFVPFLGAAQNASSCDLLVDSIPGNPNYGKYSFPMLAPDDPNMQAFAQQMANASQGLFTANDFLTNDYNAYTAYVFAADYMPTHQLSPGIDGCGQSTVQSLANIAVTSEIGQFTGLAGDTLVAQAGGGEIAQQIAGQANDIAVGLMVDSSGNPNAVIGQMTPSQTIAAPAGTYNLAFSFGGDTANATLTDTPVYPNSITNISPSSGTVATVAPPYVIGLTSAAAAAGTAVVITGTGFDPTAANDEVRFNGTLAQVDSATAATLQVIVPAGASSGPVSVTTSSGSTTSALLFTVTGSAGNPPPAITSLFPNTATAGATHQLLSIGGTGFMPSSTVTLNGVSHPVTFLGVNRITVMLTASDLINAGNYPVVVTNPAPGGGASNSATFTVSSTAPAGSGEWTWMSGSNTANVPGDYGTLGVPAANNMPGGIDSAVSWIDGSDNLWIFGGSGQDSPGGNGSLNALWEFNPNNNNWTWMSGSSTVGETWETVYGVYGNYGTQGIPSAANVPGSRFWANSWIDTSGNLWLFGGYGLDSQGRLSDLNDLWEFNPIIKMWTWVSGSNIGGQGGVYGAQGTPAASSVPGGRSGAESWIDGNGNLWLYGGEEYGYGGYGDLWEFNPATTMWTWVSGSNTPYEGAVYGTQGIPAATNTPGDRMWAASWIDGSGNLWLFGGDGFGEPLNDLWEFNPTTKMWTWVSGSNTANAAGVYGTMGVPAADNVPGARNASASWIDGSGNLWLFGGVGNLNDLWEFNPETKMWTWVSGSNTANAAGVYGTKSTPATANVPGARQFPASWVDSSGNVWIFGGIGIDSTGKPGYLNDLWRYQP